MHIVIRSSNVVVIIISRFYLLLINFITGQKQENLAGFPIELPIRNIKLYSLKNEIVLDPYLGNGSTLIACEQTDRICYGIELEPCYIDVIVQRYVNFTGNEKIKKNGKSIVWKQKNKSDSDK